MIAPQLRRHGDQANSTQSGLPPDPHADTSLRHLLPGQKQHRQRQCGRHVRLARHDWSAVQDGQHRLLWVLP